MTLLKIKAKIYQYTGIYLAEKEEQDFMAGHINSNMPDLMRGMWQASNGFYTHMSDYRVFKNVPENIFVRIYYRVLNRLIIIYKQFRDDINV